MTQSFKIGGEGGDAFPFDKIGDRVRGKVLSVQEVDQTDMDTNLPAKWDDGSPKRMNKVTLQTELRDHPGDTGVRSIYLRGSKKPETGSSLSAVIAAIIAAGGTNELQIGGDLSLGYIADGPQERRGYNKPKKYDSTYAPPVVALGGATEAPPAAPGPAATQPAAATPAPAAAAPAAPTAPAAAPTNGNKPTVSAEQFAALAAAGLDTSGFAIAPA